MNPSALDQVFELLNQLKTYAAKKKEKKEQANLKQRQLEQRQLRIDPKQQQTINLLKSNLLAQTPYTQQARDYINNLQITPYNPNPIANSISDEAGAYYTPDEGIRVNMKFLSPENGVNFLRHELVHSMDTNANLDIDGQMVGEQGKGQNITNSNKFFPQLQKTMPGIANWVKEETNIPLYQQGDPWVQDTEGMAYWGSVGQKALNSPVGSFYSKIYAPMSMPNPKMSFPFTAPDNKNSF